MIFLSASVPVLGRKYYDTSNPAAITSAIIAFAKVCAEYKIDVYFGGHPSVTPLLLRSGMQVNTDFGEHVTIFQSKWFEGQEPIELSEYANKKDTDKKKTREESLAFMREEMISSMPTECAVFIGGMEGIPIEAEDVVRLHPNAEIIPIGAGGGSSYTLLAKYGIHDAMLEDCMSFTDLFRKYLLKYKR